MNAVCPARYAEMNLSGDLAPVDWKQLTGAMVAFLEHYGTPYLLGRDFCDLIGEGRGEDKFQNLLRKAGFENDPAGFCLQVTEHLTAAQSDQQQALSVNGLSIPRLMSMSLLEILIPGDHFVSVRDVAQLERLVNIVVPERHRADLQAVIETYPVRLSMHTVRQMRVSRDVAYQYLPFVEELDPIGHTNTWIGQFHQGLLEQMYQNRVIFLLNMSCPVYCRFCFRKHKESRNQTNPNPEDVKVAVAHVNNTPSIKEIVITGGDPFMNRGNLAAAIDGLKQVPHVQTLRLATRSIAYYPHMFLDKDGELLTYLKMKNLELQLLGKRIEVATHFIHPDEVSPDSLEIISDLVRNGIPVYVQTPFLNDCNDQGPELVRLFGLLRGAGAELHYIYIPCSPIHGNSVYWSPISKGIEVAHYLRAHLSDRVMPRICTATPIGKMDWNSSGWAVEPDPQDDHFIWIRTPYTPAYFKAFAPLASELDMIRVNAEGTIDARYMAKTGDPELFRGPRPVRRRRQAPEDPEALKALQLEVLANQSVTGSIVATGNAGVLRLHETRVALKPEADEKALGYIRGAEKVTDVLIAAAADGVDDLHRIARLVEALRDIPHVNAVRLRSLKFNYRPEDFTRAVVNALGGLNRLTIADPLRLEIETQFLHSKEILPAHARLARALNNHGITVYCNTPLLGQVNDSAAEVNRIAFGLRQAGIEFHHVVVAGLPIQSRWNRQRPVDVADVIDICSQVRREGSGREIPRYIFQTALGEVDFGLTSKMLVADDAIRLKLSPYDIDYYRAMDPGFAWPEGVAVEPDGRPVVAVSGLRDTGGFLP